MATNSGPVSSPVGGFLNASGVLTDPATVTITIRDATGAITNPAPVKDGVGLYHYDIDTTGKPGIWTYEWKGSGGIQAIAANQFTVVAALL